MNLGELKRALAKFPPDMDDEEVLLNTKEGAELHYDNLAYVAVPKTTAGHCIILGSVAAAKELQAANKFKRE